jgi:hypothetical protein
VQKDSLDGVQTFIGQRAFDEANCLNEINNDLSSTHLVISQLNDLLFLSAAMETAADELTVNSVIRKNIRYGLSVLPLHRKSINHNGAYCGRNTYVATKAQSALVLLDEAERILRSIGRRF